MINNGKPGGFNVAAPAQVVSLFPFLEFDTTSWGQWALSHLAAWPRLIGGASAGLSLLPTPLQRAFVRCCAGVCAALYPVHYLAENV